MAWFYVPLGVTFILAICFGIHSLISLSSVSFPASVAAMIALFFLLILSQVTLGDRKTKRIVALVDIPVSSLLEPDNIKLLFSSKLPVRLRSKIYQSLLLSCFRYPSSQSFHWWCRGCEDHSSIQ